MATLPGQRAQFTWALNQYHLSETAEKQAHYARSMAKCIGAAPTNGFNVDQVTQGQPYPEAEVSRYLHDANSDPGPEISETQAIHAVEDAVDTSEVVRLGDGRSFVYAYGYRCAPDRLKVGRTGGDTVQRIVAQIGTGTPDKPTLFVEIRTHDDVSLERAVHAVLEFRGARVLGAGKEWFRTSPAEIVAIYQSIVTSHA